MVSTSLRTLLLTLTLTSFGVVSTFPINSLPLPPAVNAMEIAASPLASLKGTTWYVADWTETLSLGRQPVKLSFDGDAEGTLPARLVGNGGCNNFRGNYKVNGNGLTIDGAMASTRKACAPEIMEQETLFLQILPQVESYNITPNAQLELAYRHNGKAGKITFIPENQFSNLHNSQWQLLTMAGQKPIANEMPERMPNLQFNGDRLAGTGGCNRLMGQFQVDGDKITINQNLASTMMACPEELMKQEQAFVQALTTANKYKITDDGQLIIYYDTGKATQQLVFDPLPISSPNSGQQTTEPRQGKEKIVYVAPSQAPCTGVAPMTCLQIKEGNPNQPWKLHYSGIEGFDYEPGHYYRLKILETVIPNPPADGSSRRWTLLAVESKSPE